MVDPTKPNLGGSPVAPWRPRLDAAAADPDAAPLVSIVTPAGEAGALRETYESLRGQSLVAWEWILVDGGSPAAVALPDELRADARVRIVTPAARRRGGPVSARNAGFEAARAAFVYVLDAGDLLEATALEKSLWALVSHSDWSFANGWAVSFGGVETLWDEGFERGRAFLRDDRSRGGALIRRGAFEAAGGFDASLEPDVAGWDFWLRCARVGLWGGTIAEPLAWLRAAEPREASDGAAAHRAAIPQRYARLAAGAFPRVGAGGHGVRGEELPFRNAWLPRNKRLLVAMWSLASDGPGALWLDLLQLLAKRGWRVTAASVGVADAEARVALERVTGDLHVLDTFLRPADRPRYLRYLVESRRPEWVLLGAGRFGHAAAAYLRARCAGPRYAELRHLDPNDPDPAALGAASAAPNPHVDVAFSSDPRDLRRSAPRVAAIAPVVDASVWKPRRPPREWMRPQWGAAPEDLVLLVAGRLDPVGADRLGAVLADVAGRGVAVRAVLAGDGAAEGELQRAAAERGVAHRVHPIGVAPPETLIKVLSAADVFWAASETAIATLRAMGCALPVVLASDPGAADRIAAFARDPAQRAAASRAARERAVAECALDRLAQPVLEVLESEAPRPHEPEAGARAFEEAVAFFELAAFGAAAAGDATERAQALQAERSRHAAAVGARDARVAELEAAVAALRRELAVLEDERRRWSVLATEGIERASQRAEAIAVLEARIAQLEAFAAEDTHP
jgi:glycosyltransferase involved in cell wall biosynthesis